MGVNRGKDNNLTVLGKKIYQISEEERKQLMAEWRARRKGGPNGRLGYRKASGLEFKTNNFEIGDTKRRNSGSFGKKLNEHVKAVFISKREIFNPNAREQKTYYISFLSDSNRFSFEEFRENPEGDETKITSQIRHVLRRYCALFQMKNIDENTMIVMCVDEIQKNDLINILIRFMSSLNGCVVNEVSRAKILKKIMSKYHPCQNYDYVIRKCDKNAFSKKVLYNYFTTAFNFIADNKLCPWITEKEQQLVKEKMTLKRRRSYVFSHIGLLYALIRLFERFERKEKEARRMALKQTDVPNE